MEKFLFKALFVGAILSIILYGNSVASENEVEKYLNTAATYILQKDYQNALIYFQKVIEIDQNNSRALSGIGNTYAALQQQDKAIPYLEKAIFLSPNDDTAYFGLGACYMDLQQHNKAIPYLQKAIEIRPDNTKAQKILAIAFVRTAVEYGKAQQNQKAKEYIKSAIGIFERIGNVYRANELKETLKEMPD